MEEEIDREQRAERDLTETENNASPSLYPQSPNLRERERK